MKSTVFAVAVSAILAAQCTSTPARACDKGDFNVHGSTFDAPARWASRQDARDARLAITTRDRKAMLILTDDAVAAQLSDRVIHKIDRKLKNEQSEDENNVLARTIKTAVLTSVRSALDHSVECSIRDVSDVEYRHGRLIMTTEDGDRLFEKIEISDQDMMEGFSETDAKAFVREFRRLKRGR